MDAAGAAPVTPAPASDSGRDGDGAGGDVSAGLAGMTDGAVSSEPAGTVDGVPATDVDGGVPATLDDGVPAIGNDDSDDAPVAELADETCDGDAVVEIDGCAAPAGRIQFGTTTVVDGDCAVD